MINLYLCKCLLNGTPSGYYTVYVVAGSPEEAVRKLNDHEEHDLYEMTLAASDTLFIPGTSDDPSVIL